MRKLYFSVGIGMAFMVGLTKDVGFSVLSLKLYQNLQLVNVQHSSTMGEY